jgi:hypothetical protein
MWKWRLDPSDERGWMILASWNNDLSWLEVFFKVAFARRRMDFMMDDTARIHRQDILRYQKAHFTRTCFMIQW